jgi:hypothetical protein
MITVDAAGRIRLSREASRGAGFRPGQRVAVIAEGNNAFRIQSAAKTPKTVMCHRYSVERDGRIRVNQAAVANLGVTGTRNATRTMSANVNRGSIVVNMR